MPPLGFIASRSAWRSAARSVVGSWIASRAVVEHDAADAHLRGHLGEERLAGRARGDQPRRRDVGRLHRARVVHRQHDRRLLGRHRDADLRARERDDQPGHREPGERERRVAAPAGPARDDRRARSAARRRPPPRAAAGARVTRVGEHEQRQQHEAEQEPGRGEGHGACSGRAGELDVERLRASPSRRSSTSTDSPGSLSWIAAATSSGAGDPLAVDRDDHVARAHARAAPPGRPRWPRARPRRRWPAAVESAEVGAPDRLAALEPRDHVAHGVRRDREADPDVALLVPPVAICELTPITRPVGVEQRAARVARVDRRVGLDDRVDLEAVGRLDVAAGAGHDAGGRGLREPERRADRDGELAGA